ADFLARLTPGAMNFDLTGNGWQTRGREDFRLRTRAKTATPASLRSRNFQPMATASTTWPATFGNGAAIGIVLIIMSNSRKPVGSQLIRADLIPHSILPSLTRKSASIAAALSFVTTSTAPVTSSALAAKAKSTPARTILVFVAWKKRTRKPQADRTKVQ